MGQKRYLLLFLVSVILLWPASLYFPFVVHPKITYILVFYAFVFFIAVKLDQYALTKPKDRFHLFYFTGMSIRFFLSIIFLFFAIVRIDNQKVVFIIDFIFLYLFYTGFEIYFLIHNLRTDFKKGDTSD